MREILDSLRLDVVAVKVVRALRRVEIEPILLKGRSTAERLYPGESRPYRDVDLLVAPWRHRQAGRVLAGLGFTDPMAGARADERCAHSVTWLRRGRRAVVDLHFTLGGARADPAIVWTELSGRTRQLALGGESLPALDDVGLALHLALHAASNGAHRRKPLADLSRALAAFPVEIFRAAADLAVRLDAAPQFIAGLRLAPAGRPLAAALGHGVRIPAATAVRALAPVRGTGGLGALLATPVWRRPVTVARRVFPSRAVLRFTTPLARRGRLGLVAAYAVRPLWMMVKLPAALRAWRIGARAWRD